MKPSSPVAYRAPRPRMNLIKSVLGSCSFHGFVFVALGAVGVERAQYQIAAGGSRVDVELVSAPAAAAPAAVEPPLPEPPPPAEMRKEELVVPEKKKPPVRKAAKKEVKAPEELRPVSASPAVQTASPAPDAQPAASGDGRSSPPGMKSAQAAYLRNPPPAYPRDSKRLGEEGTVLLLVEIDREGEVTEVSIKASSGFSRLDTAAEKAVRRWIFKPTRIAGLASPDVVEVPVRFRLHERHES